MLKKFFFSPLQCNYKGPYVLQMDETPSVMRVEYDRQSGCILGGPFSNDTTFQTGEQVTDFLQSLGNVDDLPKSSLWGTISCVGLEGEVCPVFCLPTPLVKGVTSEFLITFVLETLQKAGDASCNIAVISTDGDPRWRAYAKNNLRGPNYPPESNYIKINHPDAAYFAPFVGDSSILIVNDPEHLEKVLRNHICCKSLIIGEYIVNMFWLEQVRVDELVKGLHKLSVSDTNVQVRLYGLCFL